MFNELYDGESWVSCLGCDLDMPRAKYPHVAIDAWNQRTEPSRNERNSAKGGTDCAASASDWSCAEDVYNMVDDIEKRVSVIAYAIRELQRKLEENTRLPTRVLGEGTPLRRDPPPEAVLRAPYPTPVASGSHHHYIEQLDPQVKEHREYHGLDEYADNDRLLVSFIEDAERLNTSPVFCNGCGDVIGPEKIYESDLPWKHNCGLPNAARLVRKEPTESEKEADPSLTDVLGLRNVTVGMGAATEPTCTCGTDKAGGGIHSDYCDKA